MGGEADRIAFFVLGLISHTIEPIFPFTDSNYELISQYIPNIVSIFFNAYILALPMPIAIFCFNLVGKARNKEKYLLPNEGFISRTSALFVGYPRTTLHLLESIRTKPWHFDFLEIPDEKNNWKLDFRIQLESPEEDYNRKIQIVSHIESNPYKKFIWIQPSIPFIILIFLGYILHLLVGNFIFILFSILM